MLELDHPTMSGSYIRDVLLPVFAWMDNLLPVDGELSLPIAVPFGFVLPPKVTEAPSSVSPVPSPDFSAFWNHRITARRTLT